MEKVIDKAVKEVRERPDNEDAKEPKQKKRKKDPSSSKKKKKLDEDIELDEDETITALVQDFEKPNPQFEIEKKQLRELYLRYPDMDVSEVTKIRDKISKMTAEDVKKEIEDIKSSIGQKTNSSEHILGGVAILLSKFVGDHRLYDRIMNDSDILGAAEYLCPTLEEYLSAPLQIAHKIAHHVSDIKFPKDN